MYEDADAIAVVGMAIRVPGAPDRAAFWANLLAGTESLSEVDGGGSPSTAGTWVRVKGVLAGADEFDAEFFGFTPREAELTDPQHRVFLELAWHAIEDAGHTPQGLGRVGVFASSTQSRYAGLFDAADGVDELALRIATESDFLATRAAYKMDLRGPAVSVQTACSSSLVAVHLAVNALLSGDCDAALAGGVTITLPLSSGYRHQAGSILSPDGHCRAFDADAAGTVPGNGGAVVLLRRLDDALADGDDIYAVVLGSALTNDGLDKIGFTAPSGAGQQAAITQALDAARIAPSAVGMIEAHGTGTPLGDPVEAGALRRVLGAARADGSWCGISATKSNIGHLDAAAGIVGFVKAVQSVHAGVIPPVAGFTRPNPELRLDGSALRIVDRPAAWPTPGRRIAGVSAFGVGGTNAHVVVAQAPPRATVPEAGPVRVTLSARTPAALDALAEALADHLTANPDLRLADVAYTLMAGRVAQRYQRTVTAADRSEFLARLRQEPVSVRDDDSSAEAEPRAGRVRLHLPGYPFQRQRHWPQVAEQVPAAGNWLAGVFGEVLGRAPDGDDDSFFDMGGDSLMAIQLLSRISAVAGVEPDLAQFFDEPTVAGLAAQLAAAGER